MLYNCVLLKIFSRFQPQTGHSISKKPSNSFPVGE